MYPLFTIFFIIRQNKNYVCIWSRISAVGLSLPVHACSNPDGVKSVMCYLVALRGSTPQKFCENLFAERGSLGVEP